MAQQPERLTTLLRSVSRAIAASEDARLRNGRAFIRSHSGIKVWSASEIEQQQQRRADDTGSPGLDERPAAPPLDASASKRDEPAEFADNDAATSGDDQIDALESMRLPMEPAAPARDEAPLSVDPTTPRPVEHEALAIWLAQATDAFLGSIQSAPAQESVGGSVRTQFAPDLTHKMLASVEAHLAKEIGPVARVLVAKYAKQSEDLGSLEAHLEEHIPSVEGRCRLKKALLDLAEGTRHGNGVDSTRAGLRVLQGRQSVAPHLSEQRGAPTPQQIQAAGAKLAAYLGPIAHVIAKREAGSVVDLDTLLQRLTEAIRNDADRNGFRAACRNIGSM
jgi:hypothetical protein